MKKLCLVIVSYIIYSSSWAQYQYPFQDPSLDIEKRIDNIISLLTLQEKVNCLSTNPSVPRLGIQACGHIEGLHGVALGGPGGWGRRKLVTTTQFPQSYGLAETWDTSLLRQVGQAEGYEARYIYQTEKYKTGALVIRSPNADLGRDPRWGRTEECYGEDPFFNGTMVTAFIKGLQGNDPKYWQAASLMKHFLANSNENGREKSSSNFDERLFREYYSVPFRMGVEQGGSRAFMASYNAWNGIPMMVNPVLKNVTVNEWKQDGIICTDGGAMRLLWMEHKYYPDSAWAAAMGIKSGINQFLDNYRGSVNKALSDSLVSEKDIDAVLRGDFRVMIKLGLLDPTSMVPYASIKDGEEPWLSEKQKSLVRLVTQKSIVLLKNENNTLPLKKEKIKSIAVIGPYANQVLLDWYSGTPPYAVSALEGLKNKLGPGITVNYTTGYDADSINSLAANADVVIMVVGNHTTCNAGWAKCPLLSDGKEAVDRQSIYLEQEEMIKKAYRVNHHLVVALIASFPYAITWTQHNVPAIIHCTHASDELGNALADVLFGDYNPGGKLVQTWPATIEQLPPMMDYDIRNGRTYMYFKGKPLYPFGFGLSYTTFSYSNFHVSEQTLKSTGEITISLIVKNTGKVLGDEVIQLYVQHMHSNVPRPEKELKGFIRITLQPGASRTVHIPLKASSLAYWDEIKKGFSIEKDSIRILIGSSSEDIKQDTEVQVIN